MTRLTGVEQNPLERASEEGFESLPVAVLPLALRDSIPALERRRSAESGRVSRIGYDVFPETASAQALLARHLERNGSVTTSPRIPSQDTIWAALRPAAFQMEVNMAPNSEPIKDQQTVTPDGVSVKPRIDGLNIRPAQTIEDQRGEIVEVYRPAWGFHPGPLVYIYQATVRPMAIRGWVVHEKQDDRIYICFGVLRWVFYDNRAESPTYKLLNDFTFSDRNRALISIPAGVFHAVRNIGQSDAIFINMPTQPYDHADPDKYRLPLKNDLIPFDFDEPPGW